MHPSRLALSLLLLAACSSSSSSPAGSSAPTGPSGPLAPEQFAAAYAAAACDTLGPCCAKSGFKFDDAGCRDSRISSGQTIAGWAALPGTKWDPVAAGACVDALRAQATKCDLTLDESTVDPCAGVVTGQVAPGGACTVSAQCTSDDPSGGSCSGTTCMKVTADAIGAAGDACDITCTVGDPCFSVTSTTKACREADGLRCDKATHTCAALSAIGGACAIDDDCVHGAFCQGALCAAPVAAGAPCTGAGISRQCATGLCLKGTCGYDHPIASGLYCGGLAGVRSDGCQ